MDRKYYPVVFAFFMALLMSCVMSFVVTTYNVGVVENLFSIWLRAWSVAFVVAFPGVLVVAPIVRKLTETILEKDPGET